MCDIFATLQIWFPNIRIWLKNKEYIQKEIQLRKWMLVLDWTVSVIRKRSTNWRALNGFYKSKNKLEKVYFRKRAIFEFFFIVFLCIYGYKYKRTVGPQKPNSICRWRFQQFIFFVEMYLRRFFNFIYEL